MVTAFTCINAALDESKDDGTIEQALRLLLLIQTRSKHAPNRRAIVLYDLLTLPALSQVSWPAQLRDYSLQASNQERQALCVVANS